MRSAELPSFASALRLRRRRTTIGVVFLGLLLGAWMFLLGCQITDDIVNPLPTRMLLLLLGGALVITATLVALLVVGSRSRAALEQHRIAAAIESGTLPVDIDESVWVPALERRADRSWRTRMALLAPLVAAFAVVQLNRTSTNVFGTLLWASCLVVMLSAIIVALASGRSSAQSRTTARQLLEHIKARTSRA